MIATDYVARIVTGAVLAAAAASKVADFTWFKQSLENFELTPKRLAGKVAAIIVIAELLIGGMLVVGIAVPWSVYSALALFVIFSVAITVNFVRGRLDVKCGCFGFWKKSKIGWQLLLRNLGFTGLACLSLYSASDETPLLSVSIFILCILLLVSPFFI